MTHTTIKGNTTNATGRRASANRARARGPRALLLPCCLLLCAGNANVQAVELIIGKERIPPGIALVFEGAIKDEVTPAERHLAAEKTHVHLEVLANWAADEAAPPGAARGGFVPYLHVSAEVINEASGASTAADLVPHINLGDNLHYARNISLPGGIAERYEVVFHVSPPGKFDLAYHKDWREKYDSDLFQAVSFRFRNVDFEEIARATRD